MFIIESWVRVVIWPLSHKSSCEDHRGLQLYFHITRCVKHCLKVSPTICFSTCIPKKLKGEKREHTNWKHMSICFHFDGLPFTIFVLTPCTSTYISAEILPHLLLLPEKQTSIGSGKNYSKLKFWFRNLPVPVFVVYIISCQIDLSVHIYCQYRRGQ